MDSRNDYKMVNTIEKILTYLRNASVVAFDFETAPDSNYRFEDKAALDPARSHICTMSISVKEGTGIMIPIAHTIGQNIDETEFMDFLKNFLMDNKIIKIAHNLSFEAMFAYKYGIVIQEPVYDTIAASQMCLKSPTEFRCLQNSGLKTLAAEICGEPLPSFDMVTGGKHFDELDPSDSETIRYSCADADFALRLYNVFNCWFDKYLPRHRWVVENIESPSAVYIGLMKFNGVPVDVLLMQAKEKETQKKLQNICNDINFLIGDVNIGTNCSTNDFKKYIFETLKLPLLTLTDTGKPSLDDVAITVLKEWCDKNRPELSKLFVLVQEYRKWGKISSTYITGYAKYINSVTERIHPNFLALSTDTGRLSCNSPNVQNMPRKDNDPIGVRNFIKAPDGCVLLSCDYSQIELRVGAYFCRDRKMMDTYLSAGDIHAATTSVIFNIPYEQAVDRNAEHYKERRTIAKNVNFGTFYGLFPKGLQRTLKFKAGIEKTEQECAEIIRNLKTGYPGLPAWQDITKREAAFRMYSETSFGRRRYLPDIRSSDWGKRSFAERCSMNTPIQGTAADIIKLSLGRIIAGLPERPYLKPILQIHDELTFIVPEEHLEEAISFIKNCMEKKPFPDFNIPLIAEASAGQTFGTLKELNTSKEK